MKQHNHHLLYNPLNFKPALWVKRNLLIFEKI